VIAEVSPAVTSAIYAHAGEQLRREIAGVLVGVHQLTSAGYVVRVTGTIRAQHTDAAHTHVTFTHETWDQVHAELERDHRGRTIVGWYHSHPGLGLFLSSMDRFICDNFFNLPWHIAMVVDPVAKNDVYFSWRGNELTRMTVVSSLPSGSSLGDRWSILASPAEDVGPKVEDSVLVLDLDEGVARPELPMAAGAAATSPAPPAAPPPPGATPMGATPPHGWRRPRRWREWAIIGGGLVLIALIGTTAGLLMNKHVPPPSSTTVPYAASTTTTHHSSTTSRSETTPTVDRTGPVVQFLAPKRGKLVSGTVEVKIHAQDESGIASVSLSIVSVDGRSHWSGDVSKDEEGEYVYRWDTGDWSSGRSLLCCSAWDNARNPSEWAETWYVEVQPPSTTTLPPTTTTLPPTTTTLPPTTTSNTATS
jgi:proteasome lid subunit RPN8/RPN11